MVGSDAADRIAAAVARLERANAGGHLGMFRFTFEDDAAQRRRSIDRLFDALDATLEEIPDVLESALPEIRAGFARNFASESAGGAAWAALAPRTLRDRMRLGFGPGPILTRTGALAAHVIGTPAQITTLGNTVELKIRPDRSVGGVPKYDALAKGYAPNNLPGRPMVVLGDSDRVKVTSKIARSLRERARAHGL